MAEQTTAKINKEYHSEAVKIAIAKGQKIGHYLSEAIRLMNEQEREYLDWQAEQAKKGLYRKRMLGK